MPRACDDYAPEDMIIDCSGTPSNLYTIFTDPTVIENAAESAFVNASFDLRRNKACVTLHFFVTKETERNVTWASIDCTSVTRDIKASPCVTGSSEKVFNKKADNLKDYIDKLAEGVITRQEHMALFKVVIDTLGTKFDNHNLDINTLHFKVKSQGK